MGGPGQSIVQYAAILRSFHYTVQPPLLDYTAHHLKTCNKVVHLSCSMNCAHNERDAYFLVVYKKALFVNLKDC